jgi:F0F1-type ATP synthase assembly protein I
MAGTPKQTTQWQDLGTAWNAVIEFSAALAVYGALGYFADKWLHTGHVLFLGGLLFGMVLGLYVLNKRLTHAEAQALAERRADRAAG